MNFGYMNMTQTVQLVFGSVLSQLPSTEEGTTWLKQTVGRVSAPGATSLNFKQVPLVLPLAHPHLVEAGS